MTLEQFLQALDRLGSDLDNWPLTLRNEAYRLLRRDLHAREALAADRHIQAFMSTHDPANAFSPASLARVSAMVSARIADASPPRLSWRDHLQAFRHPKTTCRTWLPRFAMSLASAAILGTMIGQTLPQRDLAPVELLALSSLALPMEAR